MQKRSEPERVSRDEGKPQRWEPQESSGSSIHVKTGSASDALQGEESSEVHAASVRTAATVQKKGRRATDLERDTDP